MSSLPRFLAFLIAGTLAAQDLPHGAGRYVVGLLRRPASPPAVEKEEAEKTQAAHIAHLEFMAANGGLLGAGPILTKGDLRGILIFRDTPVDKLRVLAAADPWVKRGNLVCDLIPWMGPAGIGEQYASAHKNNPGLQDNMLRYQFALLWKGPAWTAESTPETEKLQQAHLAHIRALRESGKLVAAGPFLYDGDPRGICVFQVGSLDQAAELAQADPAVRAGRLKLDWHEWMVAEGVIPR
jgi:uncharacterized protein YciI